MKRVRIAIITGVLSIAASATAQTPITTSFTYQGRIKQAGNLVTGSCDFRFRLFDAAAGGNSVGPELTFDGNAGSGAPISVANGLFRAELDFGAGSFNGDRRWLEIRVRCPHGTPGDDTGYITVAPRQEITASPYALSTRRPSALDAADGDPAQALFVDNSGDVGIGTTNTGAARLSVSTTGGAASLYLDHGASNFRIRPLLSGGSFTTVLENTAGEFAINPTTGSGYVGIGTPTPLANLHIAHTLNASLRLQKTASPLATWDLQIENDGTFRIQGNTSAPAMNAITCALDGNVGIGTPTPQHRLTVATGTHTYGFSHTDGPITLASFVGGVPSGGWIGTVSNHPFHLYAANGPPAVTVLPNGHVGIGTTAPASRLHLTSDLTIESLSGGAVMQLLSEQVGPVYVWSPSSSDALYVDTGGATRMVVTSGGNVGIGTTNPGFAILALERAEADMQFSLRNAGASGRDWRLISTSQGSGVPAGSFRVYDGTAGIDAIVVSPTGNVGIRNVTPVHPLQVGTNSSDGNGAHCTATGTWMSTCDRNAKDNFAAIDPCDVLARLADLPITSWNYTGDDDGVVHIGPTAQDFSAAFGLGSDDRFIGMVDADGVALAAIQGLHQVVKEKDAEIGELRERIKALEDIVYRLARERGE